MPPSATTRATCRNTPSSSLGTRPGGVFGRRSTTARPTQSAGGSHRRGGGDISRILGTMPPRVAIVGAGVTGLVAGRELLRRGFAVDLYERWPDVAGQASAFEVAPGVWVERYYHHLFASDREMIALHEELLPGSLEWHRSKVGIWARGRIWPFVSPRDLLGYGPLAPVDRLRLGLAVLRLVGRTDWERMDDVGALA